MGEWRKVKTIEEGESAFNEIIENETYSAVLIVWSNPLPGLYFLDEAKSCSLIHPWRAGIYITIPSENDIPEKLRKEQFSVSNDICAVMLNSTRSVCCVFKPDEEHLIEACFLKAESS